MTLPTGPNFVIETELLPVGTGELTGAQAIYAYDGLVSLETYDELSPIESRVYALGAIGLSVPATARATHYSIDGIKSIRSRLFGKLDANSMENAVHLGFENDYFVVEQPISTLPELSDRKLEVLWLASHGLTKDEIAGRMGLSFHTVDEYSMDIRAKFGVSNFAGAVLLGHMSEQLHAAINTSAA